MQPVSLFLYVFFFRFVSKSYSPGRYTSALQALSHALLLAPQNPFTALQFAETAYTAGDLPLALKMFLVVVDMGERDLPKDEPPTAFNIRAWLGVKLVCDTAF
jgi:ER membrane protein complex subunit 2